MSESAAALKKILLEKSVRTGEFTLASGKTSDLYIDCRMTALGMTLGADPISLAVGMVSAMQHPEEKLQVFTVRKEPKGHGKGKQIEGNFESGNTVIVVDDVITTGGSTLKAVDAIEREGGKVAFCLVLVDREEGGKQAIEERGIPVIALFSRHSLLGE